VTRDPEARLAYSTGGEKPKPVAAPQPSAADGLRIRVRLERRASGRLVTVVTGLPGSAADITALGKLLKSECGTGGAVKNGILELQGDHREQVEAVLRARGLQLKRSGG